MLENAEESATAQTTETDNNNSNKGGAKPIKLQIRVDKDGKKVVVADNSEPEKQSPLDRLENALKSHENEENGQVDQDQILDISMTKKPKNKKSKAEKKRLREQRELGQDGVKKRRVVFQLNQNQTREFHMHSRVATRSLASTSETLNKPLKSAIKKTRGDKINAKIAKVAKFSV